MCSLGGAAKRRIIAAVSMSTNIGEESAIHSLLLPTLQLVFLCDNVVVAPFHTLPNVRHRLLLVTTTKPRKQMRPFGREKETIESDLPNYRGRTARRAATAINMHQRPTEMKVADKGREKM